MKRIRLNAQSFKKIVALIKTQCCNCCDDNCLLLDDGESHICPQLITPSHIICRYFLEAVLPGDKKLLIQITDT